MKLIHIVVIKLNSEDVGYNANHYVGYTVSGSQNHANLQSINLAQNTLALDNYYNSLYSTFDNYIVSYNNALLQLNEPL